VPRDAGTAPDAEIAALINVDGVKVYMVRFDKEGIKVMAHATGSLSDAGTVVTHGSDRDNVPEPAPGFALAVSDHRPVFGSVSSPASSAARVKLGRQHEREGRRDEQEQ
jgi:hypothetical protein